MRRITNPVKLAPVSDIAISFAMFKSHIDCMNKTRCRAAKNIWVHGVYLIVVLGLPFLIITNLVVSLRS